jgi:DNA-nicking Smr family endonuclease
MTTAELLQARASDDQVVSWRREQLRRAGCRRFEAEVLARELRVDLHQAVELLERGCPPRIALNILL